MLKKNLQNQGAKWIPPPLSRRIGKYSMGFQTSKVTRILPLCMEGIYITYYIEKASVFNSYFVKQFISFQTGSLVFKPLLVYHTNNVALQKKSDILKVLKTNIVRGNPTMT